MNPTPAPPTEADVDLWRLRRNLELIPEERLEQLRRRFQWIAEYRGIARSAVRLRPETTGH